MTATMRNRVARLRELGLPTSAAEFDRRVFGEPPPRTEIVHGLRFRNRTRVRCGATGTITVTDRDDGVTCRSCLRGGRWAWERDETNKRKGIR